MMKLIYEGRVYGEPVYRCQASWPVRVLRAVALAWAIWRKPWAPASDEPFANVSLWTAISVAWGVL